MANRYINATLRFYDKFSQPFKGAAKNLGSFTEKIAAQNKELYKAGQHWERTGKKITRTGMNMTKNVSVPIAGVVGASLRAGMAFDQQMSKVSAISGATGKDLESLRNNAKKMGAQTKFSATEAGQALEYMAMAGWKTEQMNAGLPGIMNLAAASGEDLAQVSDIVTDSLTAFGMKAEESGHFADVLAAASSNANTNVGLMGESFKYVAPLAGSLKFTAEDTSTALGLMANSGIKASQAGTAMNAWLTRMAKPTKESQNAMTKLGISMTDGHGKMKSLDQIMGETRKAFAGLTESQKAQYAAQLAGQRGMPGLLAIVNSSTKDYKKFSKAVHETDNNAAKMAKTMMNNGAGAATILKSSMESAGIAINDRLAPYVVKIIDRIQKMVDKFNSLSPKTQDFIIKAALLTATLGPGIAIAGKFVSTYGRILKTVSKVGKAFDTAGGASKFFATKLPHLTKGAKAARSAFASMRAGTLSTSLASTKLGTTMTKIGTKFPMLGKLGKTALSPWGLAIAGVGVGLVGLYKNNEDFRKAVDKAWKGIKTAMAPVLKTLVLEFKKLTTTLKPIVALIGKTLAKAVTTLGRVAAKLAPIFVKAFTRIIGIARSMIAPFRQVFSGWMKILDGVIKFITGVFSGNWSKAWEGVKSIFKGIMDTLGGVVKAPLNAIISAINWVIDGLNKISIDIPDWVPKVGGKHFGVNISHIAKLEKGTNYFGGGMALVGERGPELVNLPRGASVTPNRDSKKMMTGKTIIINKLADKIVVREEADIDKLATALARKLEDVEAVVV